MKENENFFTEDAYLKHFSEIRGIKFTAREVDVIACLLSARRTSAIANLLAIAPRTVTTHLRNIMLKLECNTQDGIIKFVEKSEKVPLLRHHYTNLLAKGIFEKRLKEISRQLQGLSPHETEIALKNSRLKNALLAHLEFHLKLCGIDGKVTEKQDHIFIRILGTMENPAKSEKCQLEGQENYYEAVFTILQKLFPRIDFYSYKAEFNKQIEELNQSSEVQEEKKSRKQPYWTLFQYKRGFCLVVFLLFFLLTTFIFIQNINVRQEENSIRSDLPLPHETAFLERSQLLQEIDDKFKQQNKIQTVALVGPGGAGKSTLAHQYAHSQKAKVVREINAETKESLRSSFESLAEALAVTEEQKKLLKSIEEIRDVTKKEEQLLELVKSWLKDKPNWILIFDNVENFSDIQQYFPGDQATWGIGKVILTTRDNNIQNNKYIDGVIQVGSLTPSQKLTLFHKIMSGDARSQSTFSKNEEITKFLEQIPPFPLDISIAAYYLKAVGISYKEYLESLIKQSEDFRAVQENLLKESGDYQKTRYSIITLSLNKLVETHKDFRDLLFLISLLDSQNIPRDLLNKFKSPEIVNNFIYHLKKYSLMTSEPPSSSSLSFHRSTQLISLVYLKKDREKDLKVLHLMSEVLSDYIGEATDAEDFLRMRPLVLHIQAYLKNNDLLDQSMKSIMRGGLGSIYMRLGHYDKSINLLDESIKDLKTFENEYDFTIANLLASLAASYLMIGDYEKAITSFGESLEIYKSQSPQDTTKIAWVSANLGNVYREAGHYKKALNLLESSLVIYKKALPENHPKIGAAYVILGNVHRAIGHYEKSIQLLEKGLNIYKMHFPADHNGVGWILAHLALTYMELGNYQKAQIFLEQSIDIHKKQFHENHIWVKWLLAQLGVLYSKMGDFEKSKSLLEKSLNEYNKIYGEDHLETTRLLNDLGQVYSSENKLDLASQFLNKSLHSLEKIKHPDIHLVLENLADLNLKKLSDGKKKKDFALTQMLKKQARDHLERALEVIKVHYPEDYSHIKRIQDKIENLAEG